MLTLRIISSIRHTACPTRASPLPSFLGGFLEVVGSGEGLEARRGPTHSRVQASGVHLHPRMVDRYSLGQMMGCPGDQTRCHVGEVVVPQQARCGLLLALMFTLGHSTRDELAQSRCLG